MYCATTRYFCLTPAIAVFFFSDINILIIFIAISLQLFPFVNPDQSFSNVQISQHSCCCCSFYSWCSSCIFIRWKERHLLLGSGNNKNNNKVIFGIFQHHLLYQRIPLAVLLPNQAWLHTVIRERWMRLLSPFYMCSTLEVFPKSTYQVLVPIIFSPVPVCLVVLLWEQVDILLEIYIQI